MAIERVIDTSLHEDDNEESVVEFSLRPTNFNEYIGQKHLKTNLKLAIDAAAALGLAFAGIDILMGKNDDERYVCEVNSNPQLQSTIDTCGINPATNIMWHIRSQIKSAE